LPLSGSQRQKRHREKSAEILRYVTASLLELKEEMASLRNEIASLRNIPSAPSNGFPLHPLPLLPLTPSLLPKGVKRRASRLAPDWAPTEDEKKYASSKGLEPELTAERFRNYWVAKSGKDATKIDWPATWRNWCLNEAERKGTLPLTNGHDKSFSAAKPVRIKSHFAGCMCPMCAGARELEA
jgi:hypothetical protein